MSCRPSPGAPAANRHRPPRSPVHRSDRTSRKSASVLFATVSCMVFSISATLASVTIASQLTTISDLVLVSNQLDCPLFPRQQRSLCYSSGLFLQLHWTWVTICDLQDRITIWFVNQIILSCWSADSACKLAKQVKQIPSWATDIFTISVICYLRWWTYLLLPW